MPLLTRDTIGKSSSELAFTQLICTAFMFFKYIIYIYRNKHSTSDEICSKIHGCCKIKLFQTTQNNSNLFPPTFLSSFKIRIKIINISIHFIRKNRRQKENADKIFFSIFLWGCKCRILLFLLFSFFPFFLLLLRGTMILSFIFFNFLMNIL